jgi:hypothetical protein
MVRNFVRRLAYIGFVTAIFCQHSKAWSLEFDFTVSSYQGAKFHNLLMDRNILLAVQIAIDAVKTQEGASFDFNKVGFSVEADYIRVSISKVEKLTNSASPSKFLIVPTGGGYVVALSKTDLKVIWIKKGA